MERTLTLWLAFTALMLLSTSMADMSTKTQNGINGGIAGGEKVVTFLKALGDPKNEKTFEMLGKMASFLGAAGGLISFALLFIPKQDSVELKYMKEKFSQVNQKLDIITAALDKIEDLITYENQRSVYLGAAAEILFGHQRLNEFLNELSTTSCSGTSDCERIRSGIASSYKENFNVREHIVKILNGATAETSAFGDPLLGVIKKTFKCDVGKLDRFSTSVLKLAFKAQQVILAHEKLTGSKKSIVQSMEDWLKSLYDLRNKTNAEKQSCYANITSYMLTDINDKTYQVGVSSNTEANEKLKKALDEKYPWLGWVTYSYGAYGASVHYVQNIYGAFWNMPSNQNDRKRNIIASSTDKSGTYLSQKYTVLNAIDDIVANTNFYDGKLDAEKLLPMVEKELRKEGVWKYVASLNVLRKYDGLEISSDNELYFISEEYTFCSFYTNSNENDKHYTYEKVRLIIVLTSTEQANGVTCDKTCNSKGTCQLSPYSSVKFCNCEAYYQGSDCEESSQAQLANMIDAMLETTLRLPVLSDISYDIKDLREYLGVNIGRVQQSVSELSKDMKQSFDKLSKDLGNDFAWTNLVTAYNTPIRKIDYYIQRFKDLPVHYPETIVTEGKRLSTDVLASTGIQKWLYEMNFLFCGRSGTPLVNHDPLMLVFMDKYQSQACRSSYKAAVDNAWKQMILLQHMGYMLWAQALDFVDRESEFLAQLYKTRTTHQLDAFTTKTCQYSVPHSINIQCTGGNYIHPNMQITNECEENYYVSGATETTCASKASSCVACNCFETGSTSSECTDLSGQCDCKSGFKGRRCENRDCVWSGWSSYSPCSKSCDYNGGKTRSRYHQVIKHGSGNECSGRSSQTDSCFEGCCSSQFHCSNKKKCIDGSYRCDYYNDCLDNEDESSCNENCLTKYTDWSTHGGGKSAYIDRHRLNCGGHGHVFKMFHMERDGGNIRFKYTCCRLNGDDVCKWKIKYTGFTIDGDDDTVYLDRQSVDCGEHAYLNEWTLQRNSDKDKVRYKMYCCNLLQQYHKSTTTCYTSYTSFTPDGDGESYYLERQTVECNDRFFLSYFRLLRNSGGDQWRYKYRCCRIVS